MGQKCACERMRGDEVKKAVQFLRNPQLATVPLSEQIQFLEQKVRKKLS